MFVRFDEIPEIGLWLNITDASWVPGEEIHSQGPVAAKVFLDRKAPGRVLMEGSFSLAVELVCDRCLDGYLYPIETGFSVDLELLDQDLRATLGVEHTCSKSEMDVVYLEEPVVDVYTLLQQQLYLSLPEKNLCRENCAGLCQSCGANLNSQPCKCAQQESASPFAVLAKLKIEE